MKKKVIIIAVLLIIYIVAIGVIHFEKMFTRYDLGDYGVSIKVLKDYEKQESSGDLLTLFNKNSGIAINVRELGDSFWKSGDMDSIMDEYARLISAMNYDKNITDVSLEKKTVDKKEIGVVKMSVDSISRVTRTNTILTNKENGYLAIEICSSPEVLERHSKEINSIIKSLKFSENTHVYSK